MSKLIIVVVAAGLTAWFRQEVAVVRLQIFIINKIGEKTRLLLQLLLHDDAGGREAVDSQPVGDLVEADAVEQVVLTVDVKFSSFGGERCPTGAGARGLAELRGGGGPDQSIEESGTVGGGLRLDGGVDVESVDKFHQTVELAFLSDHVASVEKMKQGLDEGGFNFRQHQLQRLVVLHTSRDLVQPGGLEQLLEEG